jgi:predicted ATPase/DNA-binding winged helix-turn-helix (wHTH) protein
VIFEFDDCEIDTSRFELRRGGVAAHLEPQVFDVLRYLVEHRDRVVPKEELLDNVWGDRFVSESALTSRIKAARQAVGDNGRAQRVISTAHGRGYRFVATVTARGDAPAESVRSTRNLPQLSDQFIGRSDEMHRLSTAVTAARIVTLVGPGGVGKTRLAIEYAREVDRDTVFVDLSRVTDGPAVPRAFLNTLGVSPRSNVPDCDRLVETLETRSLLIVVDNCEQVVDAVTEVLGRIERDAPAVSILATSREALNVTGEHVVVLEPLALPDETATSAEQRASDALKLFYERAQRSGATVDDLSSVVALCRRLDGIPLALELAAARLRAFSAAQILEQLEAGWSVAVARRDHGPAHHLSLDNAIGWSFDLLEPAEQDLLLVLSAFRGAFDLPAATAVSTCDRVTTADRLAVLVDKSLVQSVNACSGRRFRLLETVRAFLDTRIDDDTAAAARERHCAHFAREVEELGVLVPSAEEDLASARLADDFDDVSAAFAYAAARDDIDAAASLADGPRLSVSIEGARWAQLALRAVELPGIDKVPNHVALLASAAWGAVVIGDLTRARAFARTGIELVGDPARQPRLCWISPQATGSSFTEGADGCLAGATWAHEQGDEGAESFLLSTAAIYRLAAGDEPAAAEHARRALELGRRIRSQSLQTRAAGALAYALQDIDGPGARRAAEQVLELAQSGDFHLTIAHRVLATLAWRAGDGPTAAAHAGHAARLIRDQGDRYVQATSLRQLAVIIGSVDRELAAEVIGVADSLVPEVRVSARDAAAGTRLRSDLLDSLGDDRYSELVDRGRRADTPFMYATVERALTRMRAGPNATRASIRR